MAPRPALTLGLTAAAAAVLITSGTASAGLIGNGACTPRKGADCTGLKAPGAKLSGKDLRNINLTGANLRKADLRRADLRGARLVRANLAGARLDGARFDNARILGATITGVSAVRTSWRNATFAPAPRPGKTSNQSSNYVFTTVSGNNCGGDFFSAKIKQSTFKGDFSYATCGVAATFQNSTQTSSDFAQVNFTGVTVSYAEVTNMNYSGVPLTGTNWNSTSGAGNNFSGAAFGVDSRGYGNVFAGTYMSNCTCANGQSGSFNNGPCQ